MVIHQLLESLAMLVPVAMLFVVGSVVALQSDVGRVGVEKSSHSWLLTMSQLVMHVAATILIIFLLQLLVGFRLGGPW